MIISGLHADILTLTRETDGDAFVETCIEAAAEITRLTERYDYESAGTLSLSLHNAILQVEWMGAEMMAKILTVFPPNRLCTLKHLGKDKAVDELIISSKVIIEDFSLSDRDAWIHLLGWARRNEDTLLIDRVVAQIAADLLLHRKASADERADVAVAIVQAIVQQCCPPVALETVTDLSISRILPDRNLHTFSSGVMHALADHGLKNTLIRMIESHMFAPHNPHHFTEQQNQVLMSSLPDCPSPTEAFGLQRMMPRIPGIKERILFDPSISIEGYIEALRRPMKHSSSNLRLPALLEFRELLTPEHLTTPDRKRRAGLLINAAVGQEMIDRKYTPEHIRMALEDVDFNPCIFKLTKVLKGTILEEELGL